VREAGRQFKRRVEDRGSDGSIGRSREREEKKAAAEAEEEEGGEWRRACACA